MREKRPWKRGVSIVICFVLVLSLCGLTAVAAESTEIGGYNVQFYYNNRDSIAVASYINISGSFTLPDAPLYKGYDFAGWSDGSHIYQADSVISVDHDMRFDAMWTVSDPPRHPFTDISEDDAYFDDVMYVYENGIMTGTSAATFTPNGPVTRAMMWTVLARMNGVDTNGGSSWYEKSRQWAMEQGITDGTAPDRAITRQEVITMLYRQAGSPAVTDNGERAFGDMEQIAGWAYDAVLWALRNGLLDIYYPTGHLVPAQDAARWELACLITRYET